MKSLFTTILFLFAININALTPSDRVPLLSYKCNSQAKFLNEDYEVHRDTQKTIVGYIDRSGTGAQQMVHEYNGEKVYVSVDVGVSGTSNDSGYSTIHYALDDGPMDYPEFPIPGTIKSSNFSAVDSKLPEKFMMYLVHKLNNELNVVLNLTCEENNEFVIN